MDRAGFLETSATLGERLGSLNLCSANDGQGSGGRLAEWVGSTGLSEADFFRSAAKLGLTETMIRRAVAHLEWLGPVPPWFRLLDRVLSVRGFPPAFSSPDEGATCRQLVRPFVDEVHAMLRRDEVVRASLTDEALREFLGILASRLESVLAAEIEEAAGPPILFENIKPELLSIDSPDWVEFFWERPALARLTATVALNAARFGKALARHVKQDAGALNFSKIRRLSGPWSDYHSGGRCVLRCEMTDERVFYYKPRNQGIDENWNKWAALLLNLPTHEIVAKRNHGWCREVGKKPVRNASQARDAVRSLGRLLAGVWLCRGTDIHAGNIVVDGSGGCLIDAETLFHPTHGAREFTSVKEGGRHSWNDSLLRVDAFACEVLAEDGRVAAKRFGIFSKRTSFPVWKATPGGWVSSCTANPQQDFWTQVEAQVGSTWGQDLEAGGREAIASFAERPALWAQFEKDLRTSLGRVVSRDTNQYVHSLLAGGSGLAARSGWDRSMTLLSKLGGLCSREELKALEEGDVPRVVSRRTLGRMVPEADPEVFSRELRRLVKDGEVFQLRWAID